MPNSSDLRKEPVLQYCILQVQMVGAAYLHAEGGRNDSTLFLLDCPVYAQASDHA